jgi:hypothetical protein
MQKNRKVVFLVKRSYNKISRSHSSLILFFKSSGVVLHQVQRKKRVRNLILNKVTCIYINDL